MKGTNMTIHKINHADERTLPPEGKRVLWLQRFATTDQWCVGFRDDRRLVGDENWLSDVPLSEFTHWADLPGDEGESVQGWVYPDFFKKFTKERGSGIPVMNYRADYCPVRVRLTIVTD